MTREKIDRGRPVPEPDPSQPESNKMPAIEKGIPIPRRKSGFRKYPWDDMEVGDSFWAMASKRALLNAAGGHNAYRKERRRYICKAEGEGARIWRVDDAPPLIGKKS